MAKVKLNPSLETIRGKIGDLIYKHPDHTQIVARMPNRTGIVASPAQLAQKDKFRLAAIYGKAVLTDPVQKVIYEDAGARKGKPAFALAVGDFLNAPAVDEIDLSGYTGQIGGIIRIRASDDVKVDGVAVSIREQGGAVLEEGDTVWTPASATWNYTATTALAQGQAVSIEVTATDLPGHTTSKTQARA
jgi:hypothetical protein